MLRIPLIDLEEVKKNPIAYRSKHEGKKRNGINMSIYMILRNAVFEYHKNQDYIQAMNYLETRLEDREDKKKCQQAVEHLQWYVEEYNKLRWPLIQTRKNITVPLTTQYEDSIIVSGQVSRLDMLPDNGYAAWLFRKKGANNWLRELQMPIIQNAVGVDLGKIHKARVIVGIISFEERFIGHHEFNEDKIKHAHLELEDLFKQMGY